MSPRGICVVMCDILLAIHGFHCVCIKWHTQDWYIVTARTDAGTSLATTDNVGEKECEKVRLVVHEGWTGSVRRLDWMGAKVGLAECEGWTGK
jgi:hypothetical protein